MLWWNTDAAVVTVVVVVIIAIAAVIVIVLVGIQCRKTPNECINKWYQNGCVIKGTMTTITVKDFIKMVGLSHPNVSSSSIRDCTRINNEQTQHHFKSILLILVCFIALVSFILEQDFIKMVGLKVNVIQYWKECDKKNYKNNEKKGKGKLRFVKTCK